MLYDRLSCVFCFSSTICIPSIGVWNRHVSCGANLVPKYKKYFIVEYRIPIQVDDIDTIHEATSRAKKIFNRLFGISPDNWFARVFEYSSEQEEPGPMKEYFYNPNSTSFREITKNIGYHQDLVDRGVDPTSIGDPEKLVKELEDDSEI